eukprot:362027-Chlamydomonas_euryale.AAC.3
MSGTGTEGGGACAHVVDVGAAAVQRAHAHAAHAQVLGHAKHHVQQRCRERVAVGHQPAGLGARDGLQALKWRRALLGGRTGGRQLGSCWAAGGRRVGGLWAAGGRREGSCYAAVRRRVGSSWAVLGGGLARTGGRKALLGSCRAAGGQRAGGGRAAVGRREGDGQAADGRKGAQQAGRHWACWASGGRFNSRGSCPNHGGFHA